MLADNFKVVWYIFIMFSLQLIYFTPLINLLTNIKIIVFFPCISRHSFYARLRTLYYNSYLYILLHFIWLLFYCMGIFSGLITLYCPFSPFSANYIATKHSYVNVPPVWIRVTIPKCKCKSNHKLDMGTFFISFS